MKINQKMSTLLKEAALASPLFSETVKTPQPKLEEVNDTLLLRSEYERNRHVSVKDFPDKTGFETFINHVHLPYNGTRESLMSCLEYANGIRLALMEAAQARRFRVIFSISGGDCVVRFHQIRTDESWVAEDLEKYEGEATMVFDVSN